MYSNTTTYPNLIIPRKSPTQSSARVADGHSDHFKYFLQMVKTSVPLVVVDVLSLLFSIGCGWIVASNLGLAPVPSQTLFTLVLSLTALFMILGLYSGMGMNPIYEFRQCLTGICLVFVFVAASLMSSGSGCSVVFAFPIMLFIVPVTRSAARAILSKSKWWGVRCVVFDCDRRVNRLFPSHLKNSTSGLRPIGFVQDELPSTFDEDLQRYYLDR